MRIPANVGRAGRAKAHAGLESLPLRQAGNKVAWSQLVGGVGCALAVRELPCPAGQETGWPASEPQVPDQGHLVRPAGRNVRIDGLTAEATGQYELPVREGTAMTDKRFWLRYESWIRR